MNNHPRHAALELGVAEMYDDHARIDARLTHARVTRPERPADLDVAVRARLAGQIKMAESLLHKKDLQGIF